MKKVNKEPMVTADRSVVLELRDHAAVINALFDLLSFGQPLGDYANDADAASGGVALYGLYRTGSTVKQRVA